MTIVYNLNHQDFLESLYKLIKHSTASNQD